jgi:hypothetical protein
VWHWLATQFVHIVSTILCVLWADIEADNIFLVQNVCVLKVWYTQYVTSKYVFYFECYKAVYGTYTQHFAYVSRNILSAVVVLPICLPVTQFVCLKSVLLSLILNWTLWMYLERFYEEDGFIVNNTAINTVRYCSITMWGVQDVIVKSV